MVKVRQKKGKALPVSRPWESSKKERTTVDKNNKYINKREINYFSCYLLKDRMLVKS
jgi:hypothetical protein